MRDLLQHITITGFPYPENLIHLFVGGSELHGAKLQGTDDLDLYGLFLEPPEVGLGLDRLEHFVWSTSGNEERNGPDDVDVTLYTLRKWAGLATKGNPTALHFLFASSCLPGNSPGAQAWAKVVSNHHMFLSRACLPQFLGFAEAQIKRITGELGRGKKGQRPDLEARFGYDVKAGMHAIRLLHEGKELLLEGKITLPRPEKDFLVRIRRGELSKNQLIELSNKLYAECQEAGKKSPLADSIDRAAVSSFIAQVYLDFWRPKAELR